MATATSLPVWQLFELGDVGDAIFDELFGLLERDDDGYRQAAVARIAHRIGPGRS